MNESINLTLTIEEANKILSALGNMPYAEVYSLIRKIHEQAGEQLNQQGK